MFNLTPPKQYKIVRSFQYLNGKTVDVDDTVYVNVITDLKKAVVYKGTKFEWAFYDQASYPYDYKLLYFEMNDYKKSKYPNDDVFEFVGDLAIESSKCTCGAASVYGALDSQLEFHSTKCDLNKKR